MTDRPRQPEGTPIGGQWAAKGHAEADVELDVAPAYVPPIGSRLHGQWAGSNEDPVRWCALCGTWEDEADWITHSGHASLFPTDDVRHADAATSSQMFDELADAVEESDPSFERAVTQLQAAQRAVLGASTVEIAKAVREAAPNAAVIVAVADDEYPGVVYLSEVRDAAGETIGERFDDAWVSKLDDDLREHLGNASVYGDYDLTGGEQLTLDVRDLIWSA